MPSLTTAEELLGLFRKSELFDAAKYAKHFPAGKELPADAADCAALLVRANLLTSYQAKQLMKEASALHQQGKHAESVAKYDEAAKVIGVTLDHKK